MELGESFKNFLKFIAIVGIVFYIGNLLKTDMTSRGVFGVEKQRQILVKQNEIYNNNPATVRYAW